MTPLTLSEAVDVLRASERVGRRVSPVIEAAEREGEPYAATSGSASSLLDAPAAPARPAVSPVVRALAWLDAGPLYGDEGETRSPLDEAAEPALGEPLSAQLERFAERSAAVAEALESGRAYRERIGLRVTAGGGQLADPAQIADALTEHAPRSEVLAMPFTESLRTAHRGALESQRQADELKQLRKQTGR